MNPKPTTDQPWWTPGLHHRLAIMQADLDTWKTPLEPPALSKKMSQVRRRAALAIALRRQCRMTYGEIACMLACSSHKSCHDYFTKHSGPAVIEAAACLCRRAGIPADEIYRPTWNRIRRLKPKTSLPLRKAS